MTPNEFRNPEIPGGAGRLNSGFRETDGKDAMNPLNAENAAAKKKQINGTEINESLKTAKKKKNKDFQKRKVES